MKKNNLDEMFAAKLREHRIEPSERAFERFNQRLDQKNNHKKLSPWYFGAAAGLVLASFGLYIFNQDEAKISTVSEVKENIKTELKEAQTLAEIKPSIKIKEIIKQKEKNQNSAILKKENVLELALIIEKDNNQNVFKSENIIANKTENEVVLIEDSREVKENGSFKPSTMPQLIAQKNEDVIITYEVEKLPQERLRRFDDEPIALAQAIQFEEHYFLHKNESHLNEEPNILTKISHQIKHLKKGEKINFRELGLRPRDILAKADRFIHEEFGIINNNKHNNTLGN